MTENYEMFLRMMLLELTLWKRLHPNANLNFQWNFQQRVGVIAAMCDAIENKFVSMNDEAKAMVKELGWDTRAANAPTVMQVKTVIDIVYGVPDGKE